MGQKRKRSSASAVAGECGGVGGRRKRLAGGPDYLEALPDDLVLFILSKLAASASSPSDLLSVHLTYVRPPCLHQSPSPVEFPFLGLQTPLPLLSSPSASSSLSLWVGGAFEME